MGANHDDMALRDLAAKDASGLVELFRSCYGESYGAAYFYDAPSIREKLAGGSLRSVVAVSEGRIIGHMGITVRHAGSRACETGNTVVHPDARGQGMLLRLALALQERVLREGFRGYVHYPTTAHDIMQRASVLRGGKETGVMLSYVAAETEYEGIERKGGRLAATVVYQPLAPLPSRDVLLPERYRALLQDLYQGLSIERGELAGENSGFEPESSAIDSHYNERRDSLQLFLNVPGSDLSDVVSRVLERHTPSVSFIDLPLDNPHIDMVIDALRHQGFRYCALLPEFAHTDVLRMQALHRRCDEDIHPNVVNPDAQRLCEFIRSDG